MSLAKVRAEQRRALDGAWVHEAAHGYEGVSFKVRGWMNPEFLLLRDKLHSAVPKDRLVDGDLNAEDREHVLTELIVETVLLDWSGPGMAEEEGGEPVPFSKEKARELLKDPLLAPLKWAISGAARVVAKEGKDSLSDEVKN